MTRYKSTHLTNTQQQNHWLDYAKPKYGQKLVSDVKVLMKILLLYVPLPLFWALLDQQGSRWTFQAARMTGEIGSFTIKPDQMQVINPLLIILFIPLWDVLVYPMLEKVGIRRPLQKLTIGMILAGFAFLISAFIEFKLEANDPISPGSNQGQLRIFNGLNCQINFKTDLQLNPNFKLEPLGVYENKEISLIEKTYVKYQTNSINCTFDISGQFKITPMEATSYFITNNYLNDEVTFIEYKDAVAKPQKGYPLVRFLTSAKELYTITMKGIDGIDTKSLYSNSTGLTQIPNGIYQLLVNGKNIAQKVEIKGGAVYTFVLIEMDDNEFVII